METNYKRTVAGSVGAGMAAVFNASGRQYYILEHKTESLYHHSGESQKIIVDQVELGRDSSCQVRFDETCDTVSRRHAAIVKDSQGWKIIPLSQTNPTFVNGLPIQGETPLNNGDEIRLSSKGPRMGFIVPQGKQSLVKSIGMTERLSLFRQQALRPYKRAIWIMGVILILAVAGLVTWNVLQSKNFQKELLVKQNQIEQVQQDLSASDALIDNLQDELNAEANKNEAKQAVLRKKLEDAQKAQQALIKEANSLKSNVSKFVEASGEKAKEAEAKNEELQKQLDQLRDKAQQREEAIKQAEEDSKSLFTRRSEKKPESLFGKKK